MNSSAEFFVVECLPFDEESLGFALPLLTTLDQRARRYVQVVDEYTNTIDGFVVLNDVSGRAVSVENGKSTRVGEPRLLGFLSGDGIAHVGTETDLAPIMRVFIASRPMQYAIKLQIAELIGTPEEKKAARLHMRQEVLQSIGSASAKAFYEGSVLRSAVWSHLVAAAPDAEIARRILRKRPRIGAWVAPDGALRLDLNELEERDRAAIDEGRVLAAVMEEFAPPSTPISGLGVQGGNYDVQTGKVRELLRRVKMAGRQEERVAILVSGILEDRTTGLSALLQYGRDRGQFANWAIGQLSDRLSQEDGDHIFGEPPTGEQVVATLIKPFFTNTFPVERGALLYYFAEHAGRWPTVNRAIRAKLHETRSVYVDDYRTKIEEALDESGILEGAHREVARVVHPQPHRLRVANRRVLSPETNQRRERMPAPERARYRRKRGRDTWHWCRNCSNWPTSDYDERETKPSGELCNECRGKEDAGTCQRG